MKAVIGSLCPVLWSRWIFTVDMIPGVRLLGEVTDKRDVSDEGPIRLTDSPFGVPIETISMVSVKV